MKNLKLWLISILVALTGGLPVSAFALKYATGLDASQWVNDASPYACRLEHYIEGYGTGAFVHVAGESRRVELDGQGIAFGGDAVTVQTRAPSWRPTERGHTLAELTPKAGDVQVDESLATNIAGALMKGMMIRFHGTLQESDLQRLEVYLSTVGFRQAFDEFTACEEQLLPANFAQLERSRIQYPVGEVDIGTAGRSLLSKMVTFLKTDRSVQQIFIDGHTDDAGLIRDNVALSQQRAERVRDYLVNAGIPESMLVVRYHAEKYPVAKSSSDAARAKNRRTTIRLSREYEPQEVPKVVSQQDAQQGTQHNSQRDSQREMDSAEAIAVSQPESPGNS